MQGKCERRAYLMEFILVHCLVLYFAEISRYNVYKFTSNVPYNKHMKLIIKLVRDFDKFGLLYILRLTVGMCK